MVVNSNKPKSKERDVEQEMLMREVDEAVRQDDVSGFAKKYGLPLGIGVFLIIAAFGAYLFFDGRSEAELEDRSVELVQAMDQLEAGNIDQADSQLAALMEGEGGVAAMARMQRAGIALEQGRTADAVALYDEVANDGELPAELRDIAAIRSVSANYDNMTPADVIARLGPIAVADNAFYGSAAELVAHAYLTQGETDQAGAMFGEIARNDEVPLPIRDRARAQAGVLGVDAIDDVDAALAEITGEELEEPSVELVE
ncbi:hypothetical protein AAW01_12025 [Aurantiacibacter gangjinensis]|uniref:Ancillary SecYEG translocon subunit/Cell division coordinator CpoB TPR domain-containing protein n=1 Tax=Aurantiacibacter gangjinensis TaxID=502682 RepID=A0A0G9MSK8_9SPHN|nr:hypothetical protein AAW01_12025 [Aurantiacibacter gangjinensis]